MTSKSWPTSNGAQCGVSRNLGPHTDPVLYSRFKRGSEESLERAKKRSRTTSDPFEGCSYIWREPQPSPAVAHTGRPEKTGSTSSNSGERRKSGKRRSTSDERLEGPRKRSRETPVPSVPSSTVDNGSPGSAVEEGADGEERNNQEGKPEEDAGTRASAVEESNKGQETKNQKRKLEEDTQEPRKRSRNTPSPEGPSHQIATPASTSDNPGTSLSVNTCPPNSRAAFEAKYKEHALLGKGGFGTVSEGYRKHDNLPVAIKHIPQSRVRRTAKYMTTEIQMVPAEVALMLKLKPADGGTNATVTLLDWYDLDDEVILVLERPVPCLNLRQYVESRGSVLQEYEGKIIAKQLVDALIEIHSKGVFHRDIKMDNILIETGSDVPRVRIIDFGCGTYLTQGKYTADEGTYLYLSPEQFVLGWYKAIPTTVWQLGVVVFGMLHGGLPFSNSNEIIVDNPAISDSLSSDCQGFILSCLVKTAEARPTLETLKHHPWLM